MHDMHRILLEDQIKRDTKYCTICALNGVTKRADVLYTVATDAVSASALACREHFREVMDTPSIPLVASEPVSQPAYIPLLEAALAV